MCTYLLNNTPPQGCLTVPISHRYSCVSTTHPKIKPLTSTRLRTDSKIPIFEIHIHPIQLRWNSSTANSPDNARVYRATIAPLDHPAAALFLFVSNRAPESLGSLCWERYVEKEVKISPSFMVVEVPRYMSSAEELLRDG